MACVMLSVIKMNEQIIIDFINDKIDDLKKQVNSVQCDVKILLIDVGILKAKSALFGAIGGTIATLILQAMF